MSSEAKIVQELYRHLANSVENDALHHGIEFTGVTPEKHVSNGFADLVVEADGQPFCVIEAKREPEGTPSRDIDPYAKPVIEQAARYALHLGTEYFATYNGDHLVLFRTFEQGTNLLDRRTRAYEITDIGAFAPHFLEQLAALDQDVIEWDPHRDAFVTRLKTFHDVIKGEFADALLEELNNTEFESQFETWVDDQGWSDRYDEEPGSVRSTFSSQAAYLLMNKLVFYKLIENADAYVDVPDVSVDDLAVGDRRRDTFDELIEAVDFEAVYEQDPIFDALPLTDTAQRQVEDLLGNLEEYNLDKFDSDVIGKIYEEIIPAEERHELGQYYTPDEIVALVTELTVTDPDDTVLDPGAGTGGFLVGAYNRLEELKGGGDVHEEVLDQVFGVDINRFPAHLCAINLAIRDMGHETHNVNVLVEDFFRVHADQTPFEDPERATVGTNGGTASYDGTVPQNIDAVVANPPYIRHENIAEDVHARGHLDELGIDLDDRSDIYCYFFTHGYQFLSDGADGDPGRLGYLTSSRWLTVGYGEDLQDFMLENTKIKAVIDFQTQQFDVPLIGTCITVLERCDDEEERNQNLTDLVLIKERFDPDEIVNIIEEDHEPGTLHDDNEYRRATFRQGNLHNIDRWDRYMYAPAIYWELLKEPGMTTLGDLADVKFGTKTGNNTYFYFEEEDEYEELGIDDQFVTPILKHISPTDYIELHEEDPHWYVLDLREEVDEILDNADKSLMQQRTDEEIVLDEFEDRGWDDLIQYIEYGEEQDVHDGASVSNSGRVWFDAGELPRPQLILPKEYWRDARTLYNAAEMPLDQRNYEVNVHDDVDVDPYVVLGIMNSSIFPLFREIEGRVEQGQGMNRNELTVGEAKRMHVPDPRAFSEEERAEIKRVMTDWLDDERTATEEDEQEFRDELDQAVLEPMGLDDRVDEIQEAVQQLVEVRERGAGDETAVLVDTGEEEERDIELPGATRLGDGGENQTTLNSF
ncbi:N-6 DNA methylase [Halostella salina]|uniref:N-6 DNA methylase n=1 Tax=Halostella salina TaxID=1547897 RepID=UPI000EF78BFF|nr:N-6 DNA methylase [Halostella salina]